MYDKEVILKKLFDLKTDIYCFVNDKCFNAKEEDKILNELNEERSNSLFWKSVVSISELVLANGGKLYFKLKDDKGIFVIEENWNKHLSQVGRYSPEEGEVLLDEEIDEDIYRNIQKFIPKFTSISEINEELKDKKINLRKTIEKIISKDIGKSKEYLVEIEDYGNDLENKFDFELYSDEYYEKLEELKAEFDCVTERRGKGLMQGLVITKPIKEINDRAIEEGLLIIQAQGNVIRFVPPLIVEKEHIDQMVEKMRRILA